MYLPYHLCHTHCFPVNPRRSHIRQYHTHYPLTMSEYAHRVGFALLADGRHWPCLRFNGPLDFVDRNDNLFRLLEYPDTMIRYSSTNELITVVPYPDNNHQTKVFLFLLGNSAWNFPHGTNRLHWSDHFRAVDADYWTPYLRQSATQPGFTTAWSEALFLLLGPELSPSRLRFVNMAPYHEEEGHIDPPVLWPCILFDRLDDLLRGLRERDIAVDELSLHRQFFQMTPWDPEFKDLPPYIYIFAHDGISIVRAVDMEVRPLLDFHENVGQALLDNAHDNNFFVAIQQAAMAVRGD